MSQPVAFTFVVKTQNNQNTQSFVPKINAHIAAHTHAKRRAESSSSHKTSQLLVRSKRENLLKIEAGLPIPLNNHKTRRGSPSHYQAADDDIDSSDLAAFRSLTAPSILRHTSCQNTYVVTDRPLLSILDPFVKLPLTLNARDKGLMHYFLNELRLSVRLAGTSANPQYCLALRAARTWMEYHPIYIIGKLLCCYFMLNSGLGKELPTIFYQRKSQLLKMTRDLLSQPEASFDLKLYAMTTVIWVAISSRQPDLPIHMHAIDSLVESHGGMSIFLRPKTFGPTMSPDSFVGMFLVAEYRTVHRNILNTMTDSFLSSLARIRDWNASIHTTLARKTTPEYLLSSHNGYRTNGLHTLAKFLSDAMTDPASFSTEIRPFSVAASPFFCVYSICITYLEHGFTALAAFDFLERIQRNLIMVNYQCASAGAALATLLADSRADVPSTIRRDVNRGVDLPEITICEASVVALKVYALMSAETRMRITRLLYDIVMFVASRVSVQTLLTDTQLEIWKEEIEETWLASQP